MPTDLRGSLPAPLPRPVRPFHDETVDSFITRLAVANHLTEADLRATLGVRLSKNAPVTALLDPLASAGGISRTTLQLALPEFLDADSPHARGHVGRPRTTLHKALRRPACRRCAGAAGIDQPVTCWTTHDRNICLRHGLWIGTGVTTPDEQIDINVLPESLRAQRHHRNLMARQGRRWVRSAYSDAQEIFLSWMEDSADPFGNLEIARAVLRDGVGRQPSRDTLLTLLFHPQIIDLAGLLASPEWERRAFTTGNTIWLIKQVTLRGILIGYLPKDRQDPLVTWVEQHVSFHKFAAIHGMGLYNVLFPRETIHLPKQYGQPGSDIRASPIHPHWLR